MSGSTPSTAHTATMHQAHDAPGAGSGTRTQPRGSGVITDREKVELYQLLAKATGAERDFSFDVLDTLVTIGQGIYWNATFDANARHLANAINEEFERQGQ